MPKENKEKLAIIIVTFNRKRLLLENLDMLLIQSRKPDCVIIVDNASTDGTRYEVEQKDYFKHMNIDYQLLNENTGGAGGFGYGVQYAFEKGYNWILLMDDDGRPYDKDTIALLMGASKKLYEGGIKKLFLNSLVTYDGKNISFTSTYTAREIKQARETGELLLEYASPFNATMISREVIDMVGIPRADFFMSCDEREYMQRCKRKGVFIATVPNSVYLHPKSRDVVIYRGKRIYETITSSDKSYYYIRNSIASELEYGTRWEKIIKLIRLIEKRFRTIWLFENKRKERFSLFLRGILDGIVGKMGKIR